MVHQLRLALRRLRREPSFAAAAILTLALGLAATTTLFAVVRGTLLRPLPYARAQDLYAVRTTMTDGRFTIGMLASEEMTALRKSTPAVVGGALFTRQPETIVTDGQPHQIAMVHVSEGFFDLFGVPMAAGRPFVAEDHPNQPVPAAVLSHAAWQRLFGGSESVVGRTVPLGGGSSVRVVGVAGREFDAPHDTDVWVARHFIETVGHGYDGYIRLTPGASPAIIPDAMRPLWADLAAKYPDQERNRAFVVRPLLDTIVGDLGPIVLIAFAATGLLLLLAIANVSNLLLARGAARAREVAVQAALGATRGHLLRQFLAESLVLTAPAALVTVPLAAGGLKAFAIIGGLALPRAESVRFDPLVLGFALGVVVIAAVLVGIVPALTATRAALSPALNEGGRAALHGRLTRRFLGAMIVGEVALAIALVAGAGRLMLSVRQLMAVDPGFTAEGRLVVDVLLPRAYRTVDQIRAWTTQAEERLKAIGATHVGVASTLPLRREWDSTSFVDIVGRPTEPQYRPNARVRAASPDLFAALDMHVVTGRPLDEVDRQTQRPAVVINEAWAKKFLPGLDPLREHVLGLFGHRAGNQFVLDPADIVGVVKDIRYASLAAAAEPVVYVSDMQNGSPRRSIVITTADGHPERMAVQIRAALAAIDPAVPVEIETMARVVESSLVWSRLGVLLMTTFGTIALVLASVGIFGVIGYVVSQRIGEMAVRLALGASRGQVFGLVMRQGGWLVVQGAAGGVLLAWWMGRLMTQYVYQVRAASPIVLAGSAVIVIAVALAATLPSARRAATVRPSRVLRS